MQKRPDALLMKAVLDTLSNVYGYPTWRDPMPAVDELVSTILSQNTNDINRDKAFQSLKRRFPEWEQVRDAHEAEIIECIRVAGLANQKGPRIKAVLNQIYAEIGSFDLSFLAGMPVEDARSWLLRFKGVGLQNRGDCAAIFA